MTLNFSPIMSPMTSYNFHKKKHPISMICNKHVISNSTNIIPIKPMDTPLKNPPNQYHQTTTKIITMIKLMIKTIILMIKTIATILTKTLLMVKAITITIIMTRKTTIFMRTDSHFHLSHINKPIHQMKIQTIKTSICK
jgi:hypothetical protein